MLLVIGAGNGVWAAKIRYHILTLPFSIRNYNNSGYYQSNIRVEALLVVSDNATTIELPAEYKSPLATNFTYYSSWETPDYQYLYNYNASLNKRLLQVKYYIYSEDGGEGVLTEGAEVSADADIYVTYEYNPVNEIVLDGSQDYNISVGGTKFLCYNRSRNNRIANGNSAAITGEHLASTEFVVPPAGTGANQLGFAWSTDQYAGAHGVHMGFWFTPTPKGHATADPYNITLMTAYTGNETYEKDPVDGDNNISYVKPYRGATLFTKILSNDDNKGSDSKMWFDCDNDLHYKGVPGSAGVYDPESPNYWEKQVDQWPGFFRQSQTPLINSVAILNHPKGGYVFVVTKMNQGVGTGAYKEWAPNKNGNYATLTNDNLNPVMKFMKLANAQVINIYKIRTYTYKIKTHGADPQTFTADMRWSDAKITENIVDKIPEVLKRKYCSYKAYADESLTTEITTFADAIADAKTKGTPVDGKIVIWLDYTVSESLPFETLPADGSYEDAHWYTMRMNGKAEAKNIAYESSGNFITGITSIGNNTNLHTGENSAEAMVAFIGDPYRLKIINRAACEAAPAGNRYVGCATSATDGTTLTTNNSGTGDIITWEIMYESTDMDNFVLRQYGTYADPMYIGWGTTGDKPVIYSTTSTRIRVVDLDKVNYTYHIMRDDHSIAIKATVNEYVGKPLRTWQDIPSIIRSPFLSTATVTYYATSADAEAETSVITHAPFGNDRDIYVRYSFGTPLSGGDFNVSLNSEYIYTNSSDAAIYSKSSITAEEAESNQFAWTLDYSDPYAMTIWNKEKGQYVQITSQANNTELRWVGNLGDATRFIVKQSGANQRIYEVMLATGETVDAGDATGITTTYYNIGRNVSSTKDNTVKLFSNTTYATGYSVLQFMLTSTTATEVTYHLIDKAGKDLLQVTTRQTNTDPTSFPPQYRSPLVSDYYYYALTDFTVSSGVYTLKSNPTPLATVGSYAHIYVTYDVNDEVNMRGTQLYLLKYEAGEEFKQEDGGDGVSTTAQKAIYPYCNGDCNFFVYGQEQYDLQQQGAASTRTRWAWSVQSDNVDPYHVKIVSRQTETFNSRENNAYFSTYKPDGYDQVVTTLTWPGIYSEDAPVTEYMVLGNTGQYQLVTTEAIEGSRYAVNSFEQYWKTFDTIRKKIYGDNISNSAATADDPDVVPNDVYQTKGATEGKMLREHLTEDLGWHSYERWAYAKRWDGCNNADPPAQSKGWEKIEHWFQTVSMGEGYFDFVETKIDPVLILLDQHGWEVMRKPLPSSPDDPEKDAKYDAIRPYNSPMVKEYAFWATAKKRTGLHQYYQIKDRIGGDDFTSTDLTNLPPYGSKNVLDKKGNLNDQYVTYIVKDEYAQSYNPETKAGAEFLIEQGNSNKFATSDGTTLSTTVIADIQEHLLNETIPEGEIWYVKPNDNIDYEIGYGTVSHSWGSNPNAYDTEDYQNLRTATYINDATLGQFSFSNGFDPYNIQISPKNADTKFMLTNATGAQLEDGVMHGVYAADAAISLAAIDNPIPTERSNNSVWFDNVRLAMTNATFMAVQDAEGNMQLMPRFDQDHLMSDFSTLVVPNSSEAANTTHTKLYRAERYDYRIIDNDGYESLRYKSGGDLLPQTPDHFKSPWATNYTYYATATKDGDTYKNLTDTIKGALDGATLTNNIVYVRYEYDEAADNQYALKGNWLTMQVNEKDAQYNNGDITLAMNSKPATVDGEDGNKKWQWKFTENTNSKPDPYAVYLYNRSQTPGTKADDTRFAILSHSEGGYALAKAGLGTTEGYNYTYQFLSGSSSPAAVVTESTFKNSAGTFDGTKSQVLLYDDVQHDFKYKVYTNAGVLAIDADQDFYDVTYTNDWKPVLPEEARTPLLDLEQYRYYAQSLEGPKEAADTAGLALSYLYGLYDDVVYTHYTPYKDSESDYLVPNVRNATSDATVARASSSNDAPVGLDGIRPYNFIWYADDMMKSNGTAIDREADKTLQAAGAYEWMLCGDDPYAIQIKNVGTETYIHEATAETTDLSATPTPFMLLNREGYQYGVLAKTGSKDVMLSGYGNTLVTGSDPNKFIIFALSTYKVIYHLMIKNIGQKVIIPFRETASETVELTHIKNGTTLRDLVERDNTGGEETHIDGDKYQLGGSLKAIGVKDGKSSGLYARDSIYCYDAGHVSLGDVLSVPDVFYRPNVNYEFYIEGVYTQNGADVAAMNTKFKGLQMTNMGDDGGLLDNIVFVNIVYRFMGGLDTNAGSDFVESVEQNKWYSFETNDATPRLAEYTGNTGTQLITQSGYATHYTNDYLWTPVGDPYGFKMYNRYGTKNGQNVVMTTSDISAARDVTMTADNINAIYELLATSTTTPGYFHVHPMVNMTGLQYYVNSNSSTGAMTLSTTPTEWTFGLSEAMMNPYYQAAGYVGGLTPEGKTKYEEAAAETDGFTMLTGMQAVVYDDDYIVKYAPGYYRLHSQPGSLGLSTPRYASGYTHKTELTAGEGDTAIPLHFYEQTSYSITNPDFTDLTAGGYTETVATRGNIPLQTVANDPASIFYFYEGTADNPTSKIQTQGLYVKQNVMTETEGEATSYQIIDIGGAIVALYNSTDEMFLCYNQDTKQYDLKYDIYASMESARWCMQPVQKEATAGNGEMGLTIKTNDGKDGYYYATFYAPFDVLLTDATKDVAYVCTEWDATLSDEKTQGSITPVNVGKSNTGTYVGNSQFVPANTPVIIRTSSTSGTVTAAIPTTTPSDTPLLCVFSGEYLEQTLSHGADYVYVFGLPYSGTFTEDDNFATNGLITATVPQPTTEVGFYKNMNYDRESNEQANLWTRNNKYVLGNKIYYRASVSGGARELTRGIDFIPVAFDVSEERDPMEDTGDGSVARDGDNRIYDMQGRMVADEQTVADGTWRQRLAPGVYIMNGRKFVKK